MKTFILVCALAAFASASPQYLLPYGYGVSPLAYNHGLVRLVPGAPLNPDGTVADTLEVAVAKAAHFAAKDAALNRGKRWAPLNPDGTVADTPEVAAAKLAHLSEVAKAGGSVPWPYAPALVGGAIPDTPEVAAAKIAHFTAHAKARGLVSPYYAYAPYWWGAAPLNADGSVADTPEVAAAKVAHFAAKAEALSRGKRSAPLNPDGTVADTPEVAAAKVAHYNEVAKARGLVIAAPLVAPVYTTRWVGPAAPLNPDGTVAETPEVKAAKGLHFAARAGYPIHSVIHGYAPFYADGTPADTPEVVAKKLEHFAAHGDALVRLG